VFKCERKILTKKCSQKIKEQMQIPNTVARCKFKMIFVNAQTALYNTNGKSECIRQIHNIGMKV
jgi:hypothetical protein